MKVILLEDIKGLGRKHDVKNVSDGYARNFLLPKKLVRLATDSVIKELATQKAIWEKEEAAIKASLEFLAKHLANQELTFKLKTGKKGEVFGSVTKNDVKTRLHTDMNTGPRVYWESMEINLDQPLKTLGEHQVKIDLTRGVKTKINVKILPE